MRADMSALQIALVILVYVVGFFGTYVFGRFMGDEPFGSGWRAVIWPILVPACLVFFALYMTVVEGPEWLYQKLLSIWEKR